MTEPDLTSLDTEATDAAPAKPECALLTGRAGTGKTTLVQRKIAQEPLWALLTSTTGISAVNLGAITINSALGYFDDESLREVHWKGQIAGKMRGLVKQGYRNLLIEEASMLTADALDILYRAASEAVDDQGRALGLLLVADFCQLPPVKGRWAFEADCWEYFAAKTERLTKVWRQEQLHFLQALNFVREGRGQDAAHALTSFGVRWHTAKALEFDGTTIVAKNKEVNAYNLTCLDRLQGRKIKVASQRWGEQRSEWKQKRERAGGDGKWHMGEWGIPPELELKVGAYVMILSNSGPDLVYANGDCGHVVDWDEGGKMLTVKLVRTGQEIAVGMLVRSVESKDEPRDGSDLKTGEYLPRPHRSPRGEWVVGQIKYLPVRLAYATSVHKSQSLTLDRVQVDFRDKFFASPGMLYTALSRARTLEGLRLVGQPEVLARHCNTDTRVRQWL